MTTDPPNNSEPSEEPEIITDLSELSFDFEDAKPSNRRSAYGSVTNEAESEELTEELELLDSLAGQITGDGPPEFYCKPLGQLLGPMSLAELRIMAESGSLAEDDLVRYGETGDWKPAGSFPRLAESLRRGSSITAESVASAPPSTRRLFQTGYKPTGDSFGEDSSSSDASASTEKLAAAVEAPELPLKKPVAEAGSGMADSTASPASRPSDATRAIENSEIKSEAETSKDETLRRKKAAKKTAPTKKSTKKPTGRKKPVKKRNDEEDAILNDIFSEVFADDQKTQRPSMPPAATSANNGPIAPAQTPSASNTDDVKTPDAPAAQ